MTINHPFKPIYNKESKILILGSFPSVKSREVCFYYGHPQNRFWKVKLTRSKVLVDLFVGNCVNGHLSPAIEMLQLTCKVHQVVRNVCQIHVTR